MTDPLRPLDHPEPRRATPLQPDQPGSGNRRQARGDGTHKTSTDEGHEESNDRAAEQETAAVDNVKEGYK